MQETIAERFAYGHRMTPELEDGLIRVAPRPATMLIGRLFVAAIFILSGIEKLRDTAGAAGYIAQAGLPAAQTLAIIAGIVEVLGGVAIASGLLARVGALGLFIYLIPVTLVFHHFWTFDGMEQRMQLVNFMKNLAIMGGLLVLVASGASSYSIDARLRRPIEP